MENINSSSSARFRGARGPGLGPPTRKGPPTMVMCFALSTTCACHLVIFISEESLFVDAAKLYRSSRRQYLT